MNYVTQSHIAELAGVTRQTISKLVRQGKLPSNRNGNVDLDQDAVQGYISRKTAAKFAAESPSEFESQPDTETKQSEKPKQKPKRNGHAPPNRNSGALLDKGDYETIKIYWQGVKEEQHARKARGDLIPRDTVQNLMSEIYTLHHAELLQLPNKHASEIASEFGVDDTESETRVRELLEKSMYQTLARMRDLVAEWVTEHVPDTINPERET